MAHKIFAEFDNVEFEIPTPKRDKTITISVPPLECLHPNDVDKMNTELDRLNTSDDVPAARKPENNAHVMILVMLKHYNPGKQARDAIDALLPVEMTEISRIWGEESSVTVGESSASTDESSETSD